MWQVDKEVYIPLIIAAGGGGRGYSSQSETQLEQMDYDLSQPGRNGKSSAAGALHFTQSFLLCCMSLCVPLVVSGGFGESDALGEWVLMRYWYQESKRGPGTCNYNHIHWSSISMNTARKQKHIHSCSYPALRPPFTAEQNHMQSVQVSRRPCIQRDPLFMCLYEQHRKISHIEFYIFPKPKDYCWETSVIWNVHFVWRGGGAAASAVTCFSPVVCNSQASEGN